MSLLRQPLLLLARSERVKNLVTRMPVSAGIVRSYVPGKTTESVVEASAKQIDDGIRVSLDFLGEDTLDAEQAEATVAAYLDVLGQLSARGLTRMAEVWRDLGIVAGFALAALALGAATLRRRTP